MFYLSQIPTIDKDVQLNDYPHIKWWLGIIKDWTTFRAFEASSEQKNVNFLSNFREAGIWDLGRC